MRRFHVVAGTIFTLVAIGHLLRLLLGWAVHIGGYSVPMWASVLAVLVAAVMAVWSFRLREEAH